MILEAIVTTRNPDGSTNIAPMGPRVTADMQTFDLKPFDTSTTFSNLQRTGEGVLHVTDDVLLFAKAAIRKLNGSNDIRLIAAEMIDGQVLADACRWYEFRVEFVDRATSRAVFKCKTVAEGRGRNFFGFNRAKHAVLEAAILATRISFLPIEAITEPMAALETIVEKTGGEREKTAFAELKQFVNQEFDQGSV